ncbi:MAG: hypothetical protein RLZ98_582 [Pseudomonadota bacterium]|jgi:hypothetical protein
MRPANAIDFWRGFALVTIFINHVPGIWYETFTHKNVSISDSAELFVFLAGWSLRLIVEGRSRPPIGQIVYRLYGRAFTLYCAHLLIVCIAIASLAVAAIVLQNPLILEWHNAAHVFYDPVRTHVGLVFLTHQLGYFDILPLYIVLMLWAPILAIMDRFLPGVVLPFAFGLYVLVLSTSLPMPTWPTNNNWFFNPLAWQLVFTLGFVLGGKNTVAGRFARRNIAIIRALALPIVIGGAIVAFNKWWPDPTAMPDPKLLFIWHKTYLTPIRLIQFLALVAVMSAAFPYIVGAVPTVVEFLSMLGRNSLHVFCLGSVLSLWAQIIRYVFHGYLLVDTVIILMGLVLMAAIAWVVEWKAGVQKA